MFHASFSPVRTRRVASAPATDRSFTSQSTVHCQSMRRPLYHNLPFHYPPINRSIVGSGTRFIAFKIANHSLSNRYETLVRIENFAPPSTFLTAVRISQKFCNFFSSIFAVVSEIIRTFAASYSKEDELIDSYISELPHRKIQRVIENYNCDVCALCADIL